LVEPILQVTLFACSCPKNLRDDEYPEVTSKRGQFFTWKKRLREAEPAKFVAMEVGPVGETKWPAAAMHSRGIEVRLDRGRSLVAEPEFVHTRSSSPSSGFRIRRCKS